MARLQALVSRLAGLLKISILYTNSSASLICYRKLQHMVLQSDHVRLLKLQRGPFALHKRSPPLHHSQASLSFLSFAFLGPEPLAIAILGTDLPKKMTKPRSQLGDLFILPVFLLIVSALSCIATRDPFEESATLVPEPKIDITYHGGPLLSGKGSLPLYILWYGHFSPSQQLILKDFFASFSTKVKSPSVRTWWSVTSTYKDAKGITVFPSMKIVKQIEDNYSMGKFLARNGTKELVLGAIDSGKFPRDTRAFYLVLTAEDVEVHGFCVQTCAYHRHTEEESAHPANLAFGWVGNSMWKCAGKCAWPFAHPRDYFGPDKEPLVSPNADVGVDGMIINIAMVLAGAATNPFGNGYYQGHELSHLGAASACAGIYGKHAYPGEPGQLRIEGNRKASFNTFGANGRKFLLPAIWDPLTSSCAYPL